MIWAAKPLGTDLNVTLTSRDLREGDTRRVVSHALVVGGRMGLQPGEQIVVGCRDGLIIRAVHLVTTRDATVLDVLSGRPR